MNRKAFITGATIAVVTGLISPSVAARSLVVPSFNKETLVNLALLGVGGAVAGMAASKFIR